eukprot:10805405-Ditylum_brightwellii.AAC.1
MMFSATLAEVGLLISVFLNLYLSGKQYPLNVPLDDALNTQQVPAVGLKGSMERWLIGYDRSIIVVRVGVDGY